MNTVDKSKVVACLRELADRSFQERVWLASSGPEISSITEATCGLFDDSGLDIALEKGHTVFTEEIDKIELLHANHSTHGANKITLELVGFPSPPRVRRPN
jgi:hypothetical protein